MASKNKSRVSISLTPKEWKLIDDKLAELKRSNVKSYLRGEISKLAKDYVDSHKKICAEVQKREKVEAYVNPKHLQVLELMSLKTGIPVAQIVNQLIIFPLIISKP